MMGISSTGSQPTNLSPMEPPTFEDDVAGSGEEVFDVGMRQNAMEWDAGDQNQDRVLDFSEFCHLVRDILSRFDAKGVQ